MGFNQVACCTHKGPAVDMITRYSEQPTMSRFGSAINREQDTELCIASKGWILHVSQSSEAATTYAINRVKCIDGRICELCVY